MDIEANEILLRGLSMPHSPRWHQGKLWLLESGEGSLAQVDLERRTWQTVAQLPGFTRGIDFVGPLAFIGLSQVRESAVFSGIPLVERVQRAYLWSVDSKYRNRPDSWIPTLRSRRARDIRRTGAARDALPRIAGMER